MVTLSGPPRHYGRLKALPQILPRHRRENQNYTKDDQFPSKAVNSDTVMVWNCEWYIISTYAGFAYLWYSKTMEIISVFFVIFFCSPYKYTSHRDTETSLGIFFGHFRDARKNIKHDSNFSYFSFHSV